MLSEIDQKQKDKYCIISLNEISRIGKFIEMESRFEGLERGRDGEYCLMVVEFLFVG